MGQPETRQWPEVISAFEDAHFLHPVEPPPKSEVDIDDSQVRRQLDWPDMLTESSFDLPFQSAAADKPAPVESGFDDGFSGLKESSFGSSESPAEVDEDDLQFHQALGMVMDEGETHMRSTISDEALTDHRYNGPLEGVRYP